MEKFKEGDKVKWKWGDGYATGTVRSVFFEKTTRKIKGTEITRNGSKENPAIYIEQEDGDRALKLASELDHD